jgi:hypothetical protein
MIHHNFIIHLFTTEIDCFIQTVIVFVTHFLNISIGKPAENYYVLILMQTDPADEVKYRIIYFFLFNDVYFLKCRPTLF